MRSDKQEGAPQMQGDYIKNDALPLQDYISDQYSTCFDLNFSPLR